MKLNHNLYLLICLLLFSTLAEAQDPHFTQWHANYNQLNPALTGISNNPHLQLSYRNQWPSIPGGFVTNVVSYDQRISPKAGYIGACFLNDVAGDARLTTNSFALQYAYQFDINEDLNIRAGAEMGIFQRSVDIFNIHSRNIGPFIDTSQSFPHGAGILTTEPAANFALGTVVSYKNIFGGFSVHNLLEPMQSFFGNPLSRLPRRFSANVGAFLPLHKADDKSLIFAPYIVYQKQAQFVEIVPGININKGIFTGGISVRQTDPNTDAVNFLVCISKGWFKGGYSYDYTVSDARSAAKGSHELSLSFYFGKAREGNEKGLAHYFRKMGI
jgi:type IX secretion system PorP/SprF family membrane protein